LSYIYEYFISFMLSFIIAFSSTPIAKKIAFKIGAVDVPNDGRRMHKRAIAKLGGMAIVSGFMITIIFNLIVSIVDKGNPIKPNFELLGLMIGIIIIVIMGLIDDIKGLSDKYKLLFQLAAAIVVVVFGTKIQIVTNPFSNNGFSLNPIIYYPLTIFWIVGVTNAINLIDGLDGLAAGVSSIASLSLFIVCVISGRWDSAIITVALAGATLGFLPYNFNPAKIFMADTGSNFLGFTLAVVSIQGTLKSYAAIAIAIPLLVLGLPLFDTLFAILRRIIKGKSIMEADRGHLHHRLIDMGLSHKQSVMVMYIFSASLGLCAIVLADKGVFTAILLVILVSAFIIGGVRYMSEINDTFEENGEGKIDALKSIDTTGIEEIVKEEK
jgi:UDP-GlcNAc:undecaprenyl-phosphate/decaprenyl-phosphate GlcNAc-1-phosphate transferase